MSFPTLYDRSDHVLHVSEPFASLAPVRIAGEPGHRVPVVRFWDDAEHDGGVVPAAPDARPIARRVGLTLFQQSRHRLHRGHHSDGDRMAGLRSRDHLVRRGG